MKPVQKDSCMLMLPPRSVHVLSSYQAAVVVLEGLKLTLWCFINPKQCSPVVVFENCSVSI